MGHTKGNWIVGRDKHSNICVRLDQRPRHGYDDMIISEVGDPTGEGCIEANAALIAAAPELLEACETVLKALIGSPHESALNMITNWPDKATFANLSESTLGNILKSAIQKAKGE